MRYSKREFLATCGAAGAALAASSLLPSTLMAQPRALAQPPLQSDIGKLERVLVHSMKAIGPLTSQRGRGLIPYADYHPEAMEAQHAALIDLLQSSGAEVIEVVDALNAARAATLESGVWEAWVDTVYPRLGVAPRDTTAEMIFGQDEDWLYRLGSNGDYDHVVDELGSAMMWTRDSAFMTPKGLVICNSSSARRSRENMILRFLYRYSPMLNETPIAVDAVESAFIVEGGDAIVADAETLFLGVGGRTSPEAAPILARELDMDVIAVTIGPATFLREKLAGETSEWNPVAAFFLHLDTSFTLVGPQHALALPYVFEIEHAEDNPLSRYVRGAMRRSLMSQEKAEQVLEGLKGFGSLKRYAAGTGEEETLEEKKLLDLCREMDYTITHTGGPKPEGDEAGFRHFMKVTYGEQRRQASNVVQAEPGRVIAYEGNPATIAALRADGLEVDTFPGRELWQWHGGPHCLTQPLIRS